MSSIFRPNLVIGELPGANPEQLAGSLPANIKHFLYDMDSTVVGHHEARFSDETMIFFEAVHRLGMTQGFISNAAVDRTPRALALKDQAREADPDFGLVTSAMVGSHKPSPKIHRDAAERFGIGLSDSVYFGDLWLKDVLSAKRAGYGATVLTAKYGEGDNWKVGYLERPIQEALLPLLGIRRPSLPEIPGHTLPVPAGEAGTA